MSKTLFIFFCFATFVLQVDAQNLVPNGSFEEHTGCPTESAQFNLAKYWESPSEATPDLICDCASTFSLVNTALNFAGRQAPRTGNCYGGFLAYHSDEYYEYFMVKLDAPLIKGKKYLLSFFYTLSDFSDKQVATLGAWFREETLQLPEKPLLTTCSLSDSIVNNVRIWKEFSSVYTALGSEQYLLIGCFAQGVQRAYGDAAPEGPYGPGNGDHFAYYYIDDISLTEYKGGPITEKEPTQKQKTTPIKPELLPKNIYFDTDKSEILPQYYKQLDLLAAYLKENPKYKLVAAGHTDNTGDEAVNKPLSLERANAVKMYLVKKGVSADRITCNNYSSSVPLKNNDTETHKHQNRRVELKIVR